MKGAEKLDMDIEKAIHETIVLCDRDDRLVISEAFPDGGLDPLFPRLERAAMNQLDAGKATVSRYGIWANTVRDNILHSLDLLGEGKLEEAKAFLTRAVNSLSAFAEIQAHFDPLRTDRQTFVQTDIRTGV